MGLKVLIDIEACQGYACCMMEAPTMFDLDEATGKAFLLDENPTDGLRSDAERAVRACPARAITLENG
jgi:ferredoxin